MPSWYADVPDGVDFAWCPQGCGNTTDDPYGGPCKACWDRATYQRDDSSWNCCDLHNRHCEPPADVCCWLCTEIGHPAHLDGSACVLDVRRD